MHSHLRRYAIDLVWAQCLELIYNVQAVMYAYIMNYL
jgi:hypothetical protein